MRTRSYKSRHGFTLIELLTVIAVIGILAAIIIPVTGRVRTSAKKTQTRTMFSQWIQAAEMFKSEYGFYPVIGSDGTDNLVSTEDDTVEFVRTLTAKEPDGTDTPSDDLKPTGNKRRQTFLKLSASDILRDASNNYFLVDAFGNTEFGFIVDRNGDGVIKDNEDGAGTVVEVEAKESGRKFRPKITGTDSERDIPTNGVRAGVLVYSAGRMDTDDERSNVVMSWK